MLQQGYLVQQTVGCCSPGQATGGGLVWDCGQEDIQVVLEEGEVPRVLISEIEWQQVKDVCPMNSQGPSPGHLDLGRSRAGNAIKDSISPSPVTPLPVDGVAINQPLAEFPEEAV